MAEPATPPAPAAVRPPVIAIDGPAASGKGTIAWSVARALGFHYLDSGSLYRLIALQALERSIDPTDAARLVELCPGLDISFRGGRAMLDGRDVADALRTEEVSSVASQIAVHASLRRALIERQRAFRAAPGLVAEGRDMGTVVFPDAQLKVFLTASAEERAQRRHKQLIGKGSAGSLAALSREIAERDLRDSTRQVAPLKPAPDAQLLDSTGLSIEAVVERVISLGRERQLWR